MKVFYKSVCWIARDPIRAVAKRVEVGSRKKIRTCGFRSELLRTFTAITGAYARGAAKALPNAVQVADRWQLMKNASRAFLDAVRRSMRPIRCAVGAMTIKPELLTAAERLQYEGYLHREETNAAILALSKEGVAIEEIVRRAGHSRGTVRRVLCGERSEVFRTRETSLEAYLPWLDRQWAAGCQNGAALWRSLQAQGFRGSLRVVTEWAKRRRRAEKVDADTLHRLPSARTIAPLMTIDRNDLSKAETLTVAAVETGVRSLVEARQIGDGFQVMIRRKANADLDPRITRAAPAWSHRSQAVSRRYYCGSCRRHLPMVERPDRRADHQAQAGQTPDVRPRKTRPSPRPADRSDMTAIIKTASEPILQADSQSKSQIASPALRRCDCLDHLLIDRVEGSFVLTEEWLAR